MRTKPTATDTATDKYSAINKSGEYLAITPAIERFVMRDQAARAALEGVSRTLDQVLVHCAAARAELAHAADALAPDPGRWIHFGPCAGELVRLHGIVHPVCTRCGQEVF
jgi:hypothetical protein